ncbi:hypothetical protein F9C07_10665 [Aspergillus flavus]|uniref:Uncharacterized protein n=1 Tax=Aspergillus flavus (strain ATCC 200026 / FGSC A1120 / IAM 13836 / NRRL 3357 / JCM 12722 / SRRC 167) TaxID=332952 RepID=A0A7U2QZL1_ASPFN|nr:hypothetical protein F9C07_10665 [Aspergillus flavus]
MKTAETARQRGLFENRKKDGSPVGICASASGRAALDVDLFMPTVEPIDAVAYIYQLKRAPSSTRVRHSSVYIA